MKWIEKWKESKEKQKAKDIERCRQHPNRTKIMMIGITFGFALLIVSISLSGAYPLAIIASIFAIWMVREYIILYREAFSKKKVVTL